MSVIKAKLITYRNEPGGYIIYVFEDLEHKDVDRHYIKTVRFPHWESPFVRVGEIGYLEYNKVEAGKDSWYDNQTQMHILYKYNNTIFKDFVHEVKEIDLTVML